MFNLFNLVDEDNKKQEEVKNNNKQGQTTEESTVELKEDLPTVDNNAAKACTEMVLVGTELESKNNTQIIDAEFVEVVEDSQPTTETSNQLDTAAQIREKMNEAKSDNFITEFNDPEVTKQEQKLEEEKEDATTTKPVVKKEEKEKFAPNEFTIIRYYGQDIPVTKFLTVEELAEGILGTKNGEQVRKPITAEELRKRMEKVYPELVSSHTELLFIEKKGVSYIVPTIKAKKKGAELVTNDTVSAFPLIPYRILGQFIELAKLFAEQHYEVHADIYYNYESKEFLLDVPGQAVHEYWCKVTESERDIYARIGKSLSDGTELDEDDLILLTGTCRKVVEIHSHHTMQPIPSAVDNVSETVPTMNYVIVGNIQNDYPSITARRRRKDGQGWDVLDPFNLFERPPYKSSKVLKNTSYQLPNFDTSKFSFVKGALV